MGAEFCSTCGQQVEGDATLVDATDHTTATATIDPPRRGPLHLRWGWQLLAALAALATAVTVLVATGTVGDGATTTQSKQPTEFDTVAALRKAAMAGGLSCDDDDWVLFQEAKPDLDASTDLLGAGACETDNMLTLYADHQAAKASISEREPSDASTILLGANWVIISPHAPALKEPMGGTLYLPGEVGSTDDPSSEAEAQQVTVPSDDVDSCEVAPEFGSGAVLCVEAKALLQACDDLEPPLTVASWDRMGITEWQPEGAEGIAVTSLLSPTEVAVLSCGESGNGVDVLQLHDDAWAQAAEGWGIEVASVACTSDEGVLDTLPPGEAVASCVVTDVDGYESYAFISVTTTAPYYRVDLGE